MSSSILLQVLDDGRLTDGQGRVVSFKNAIIIMTSNIGSQTIRDFAADAQEEAKEEGATTGRFGSGYDAGRCRRLCEEDGGIPGRNAGEPACDLQARVPESYR